jgi:UDP-2,3-diacylglucosamine pyrophosphatase LpxH
MDIKTLFISDTHLGSRHSHTADLLAFLDRVKDESPPEKIYIVGDFIDGWKLKRNWTWDDQTSLVVRKLLSFLRRDAQIYWVAGNHDEFIRGFIDDFHLLDFGHIHIGNEFEHTAADGTKYLVVHGDQFDLVAKYAKWLCYLGDRGYSFLLWANRFINWGRRVLGLRRWSLSKAIKYNVKQACNFISDFEAVLGSYAKDRGFGGVVCGHIHHPELRTADGFVYANTGDWVESCTAIYEDRDGRFHLYQHAH